MLNHVVILTFKRRLEKDEQEALHEACMGLLGEIKQIRSLQCGFDMGLSAEQGISFSLSATFQSSDDYLIYSRHPAHLRFVQTFVSPYLAENGRKAVQYLL